MSTTFGEVCQFCNNACGPHVDKHPHECHSVNHKIPGSLTPDSKGLSPEPVDNVLSRSEESAHAHAMSLIDGCPQCVLNTEMPYLAGQLGSAWRCMYRCSDCGHSWTTDWKD